MGGKTPNLSPKLYKIENLETFLPLFLEQGAFAVYKSLSTFDKNDYAQIKKVLTLAFSADQFKAYDLFVTWFFET